jgi:hypothetical protein
LEGDHSRAETLYRRFKELLENNNAAAAKPNTFQAMLMSMWDIFVVHSAWKSSVLAALPSNKEDYNDMEQVGGLVNLKRKKMTRSRQWLEEHGVWEMGRLPRDSYPKGKWYYPSR